jgi:siroheme synthase, N-terminal domain
MTIRERLCVVVGGGEVGARKVSLLLEAGGHVRVVAPRLCKTLDGLAACGRVSYRQGTFEACDLTGAHLVIAATPDPEVNRQVSELAKGRQIPVNVVDQPALCTFIMPAVIDRSPVLVAISTGGAAPVLARLIRGHLEGLIPTAFGRLAALAAEFRIRVKQRLLPSQRRAFWERVFQGPVAEMVFSGREEVARAEFEKLLEGRDEYGKGVGEVYLVGGGPGDPELLTLRALRLMQRADVVVYDRVVSPGVLKLVRSDAECICTSMARDIPALPQEEINELLLHLAKQGKRVVRLKGGDPFTCGDGSEEIQTLAQQGIPFQIVPGIRG